MFAQGGAAVNGTEDIQNGEVRAQALVFVSYATSDRKKALSVCEALERRGATCWISCRDVEPGENYQEAIVRHVREARAMVLVFSDAANNNDEIKKELSLASRYRVPVLALRIEDVDPSDAFAYELSTRQWIDAFAGWDRSLDALARKIGQIADVSIDKQKLANDRAEGVSRRVRPPRAMIVGAALTAMVLVIAIAAWLLLRPGAAAAHSMFVRLAGFDRLSPDIPAGLPDALGDEIMAAFTDDGTVGVSTAAEPSAGTEPAYALSGTVRREVDQIRVIAKLGNERSGTTLWSNTFKYKSTDIARIPRWIAVDVGNLVRCGLFAASTYPKALPDPVLSDYLQFCQSMFQSQPTRALDFARKVVAAAPDFSWGWSAVAMTAGVATLNDPRGTQAAALQKEAFAAAARAIALDRSNSEAFQVKSYLINQNDLVGRETLLKQALVARPLASWSEHYSYGALLDEVGRTREAIEQYRRSIDVVALHGPSHTALGVALLAQGKAKEAKTHFDAAADISTLPGDRNGQARMYAVLDKNYAAVLQLLDDPASGLSVETTAACRTALRALQTGNEQDRMTATKALASLSPANTGVTVVVLLAALGANSEALGAVETRVRNGFPELRSYLFNPAFAKARVDPSFPGVAQRLGLMRYWKTTHTKPDVCLAKVVPTFCRMI
jgi:tetratricopeptide (TPR) repeat protein